MPATKHLPELTPVPILVGAILGIVFGASSLYLALKVGMTVSASIPVAVLSITLFRGFSKILGFRRATILENNIVQTTGSAGESIAFGVAVTMPALMILGYEMELGRLMTVSLLGALLGVLMMIPLRHSLVVDEHHELTFPEGTACAKVLIVGEQGGVTAKTVFAGFFLGLIYKVLNVGMRLWNDVPERAIGFFKGAAFSTEVSPELLGIGYVIGPKTASTMVAGGVLSSWVLTPLIKLFGEGLHEPLFPGIKLVSEMSLHEIWKSYVLYIGAGAVAAGGLISLARVVPTIIRGASAGLGGLRSARGRVVSRLRTDRDIPAPIVAGGVLFLIAAIWAAPSLQMNLLGACLVVLFGFFFVTVSSRLTGEIGSSSNPISGMTVATLLITSLVFLALGWVEPAYRVTALCVAAVVCIASSNGGSTAQDLKTGYLVGATPRHQQIAILIGSLTSALAIGYSLEILNNASTIYSKKAVPEGARIESVTGLTRLERVKGQGAASDPNLYHVLQLTENTTVGPHATLAPGKYLVDDSGQVRYLVDPGINGVLKTRDDGQSVVKYEAPKARLMSLIIDGILSRKLPWGLVLLGAAIAIVMELCGVSSLPFAVGVYLPLSSSAPIFFGGLARWLVDRTSGQPKAASPDTDSSPGILFSSGLIAGGSIAGIALAILAVSEGLGNALDFSHVFPFSGSDWTSYLAFAAMFFALWAVGTGRALRHLPS